VSLSLSVPLVLAAGLALASRSGDPRTRAETAIQTLTQTPAHAKLARESIASAKHALRRADDARAAADHDHAAQLEALALEHAETGVDLTRAAEAERQLGQTQRQLSDVETQLTRARALLEETVARRGRAQAKLDELERSAGPKAVTPTSTPGKVPAAPKGGPR